MVGNYSAQFVSRAIDSRAHAVINDSLIAIQTADDCVCVITEGSERYCGDYGIVTFSIGALQAAINEEEDSVRFEPPLPEEKQNAINKVTLVQNSFDIQQHILE